MALFVCAIFQANALTYSVTVPAGTNACYIAGEMNDWTHQPMIKVDDTHYTIDLANAKTTQAYKYCSGPGWGYVEKAANGWDIDNRTYGPKDEVKTWTAVFDKNVPDAPLTYQVTVPPGTHCCYIAGGWDNWQKFVEMKQVAPNTFSATFRSNIALKYVYLCGNDWKFMEMKPNVVEPNVRSYSEKDVVSNWNTVKLKN